MPVDAELYKILERTLPYFFPRSDVGRVTNGAITPKYMAKLATMRKGPQLRYIGAKCFYVKEEFLAWMLDYYKDIGPTSLQDEVENLSDWTELPED